MQIEFWYWFIFGVALIVLEVFAPGVIFLWIGLSALLVGAIAWVVPAMGWEYQILLFAVFSVVATVIAWKYLRKRPIATTAPHLNEPGAEHIGKVYTLTTPIQGGVGQARVGDGLWRVKCDEELGEGARVRVVSVDGASLRVTAEG